MSTRVQFDGGIGYGFHTRASTATILDTRQYWRRPRGAVLFAAAISPLLLIGGQLAIGWIGVQTAE